MKNDAIGVFDSGMGGLTTVKELNRLLPHENIIYFGDTARVPYGSRSPETILRYAKEDVAFLQKHQVKMIIAACGTVSSIVGDQPFVTDVPFAGVIYPAVEAACAATKTKRIGIIGTSATIKSKSYAPLHRRRTRGQSVRFCSGIRISLLQRRRARCSFIWWRTVIPISTIL